MNPLRGKFQVWSDVQQRWRTAYCLLSKLRQNVHLMHGYGIPVRSRYSGYT